MKCTNNLMLGPFCRQLLFAVIKSFHLIGGLTKPACRDFLSFCDTHIKMMLRKGLFNGCLSFCRKRSCIPFKCRSLIMRDRKLSNDRQPEGLAGLKIPNFWLTIPNCDWEKSRKRLQLVFQSYDRTAVVQ